MDDPTDLGLGDNFFEDNSDLGRIFDDEDGGHSFSLDDSKSKLKDEADSDGSDRLVGDDGGGNNKQGDNAREEEKKEEMLTKKKRRRSSSAPDEGGGPTPAWHNGDADRPHREEMIQEM